MYYFLFALVVFIPFLVIITSFIRRSKSIGPDEHSGTYLLKQKISQLEIDKAEGEISDDEYNDTKIELYRRILEVSRSEKTQKYSSKSRAILLVISLLVIFGGGVYTYINVGVFGYPDIPLQERLDFAEKTYTERPNQNLFLEDNPFVATEVSVDPGYLDMVNRLREVISERPDDVTGLRLLVQSEANMGQISEAAIVQQKIIELLGDNAQASDFVVLASFLIEEAGGYVSPEAEYNLRQALEIDKDNRTAKFYMGAMFLQTARPDLTFRLWAPLLENSEGEPWVEFIKADIKGIAESAGNFSFEVPNDAGPSQEDIQNAMNMSPEDRLEFIQSMVDGLKDKVAEQGGTYEDYKKLLRAQKVLGDDLALTLELASKQLTEIELNSLIDFVETVD